MPGHVSVAKLAQIRARGQHAGWLVDLDGTLYHPGLVKLAMAAELALFGLREVPVLKAFRRQHEWRPNGAAAFNQEFHQEDPFRAQLERTANAVRMPLASIEPIVGKWMFERPGKYLRLFRRRALLRELQSFQAAGGRLALVSDYPARAKLQALGCASLFELVVASGEPEGPRALKPSPEGYLAAAGRLGLTPTQCLVVGDREDKDGEAARQAGMDFLRI
jgi:HAD superfamily hydrolase (TIGR01549 family)